MTGPEIVRAELEVLGLDASRHVVDFYTEFLDALGITRSRDLMRRRSQSELLVAGIKVATQTPPVRSGRRVIFLTLDDSTGPVDATFFEDAQGPYAGTLFHSWLLVVRGILRRTGPRGVSLRATGCWELTALYDAWRERGPAAVEALMDTAGGVLRGRSVGHGGKPVHPPGDDCSARRPRRRHRRWRSVTCLRARQCRPRRHRCRADRGWHGPPSGACPPQWFPPVALRRPQTTRRRRQEGTAQALALQPGELGRMTTDRDRGAASRRTVLWCGGERDHQHRHGWWWSFSRRHL